METQYLTPQDSDYPASLVDCPHFTSPGRLAIYGNLDLLQRPLFALFCSVKCPGDLILKTYDFARNLCAAGVPTIGGFHSPMEKECLTLLLRGQQPIVACPARGIENMRLPAAWRPSLQMGRLLVLSPFKANQNRPTEKTATQRNHLVAALASEIFVAYAESNGKTSHFCQQILDLGKPLLTFDTPANQPLIDLGAQPIQLDYRPSIPS
jgi:predicted Rossmann fold nucleotide-binding protein DprA/Smf involved in DNA uptake